MAAKASVDQTKYQDSKLTDGTTSSNHDRDFSQYGGTVRASYEVFPGVKPFVEVGADTRKHELQFDRDGYQRDSQALTPKVGTTFEITRKLTGEISVGYLLRHYQDPRLQDLRGVVVDASLKWEATGLTTATLTATSRAEEIGGGRLVGRAAARRRRAGRSRVPALADRHGAGGLRPRRIHRTPRTAPTNAMSLGAALTYKFNRDSAIKGEYRYDQLRSNAPAPTTTPTSSWSG